MKALAKILFVLAILVVLVAGIKVGPRVTALSANALLRLVDTLLLGVIAVSLLGYGKKGNN